MPLVMGVSLTEGSVSGSRPVRFAAVCSMPIRPLSLIVKTYIAYDPQGHERPYIKARSHNEAEGLAVAMYGRNSTVCYTEL